MHQSREAHPARPHRSRGEATTQLASSLPWIGGPSAVLFGIFAGHSVRQRPQLGASWRAYLAARHSLIPFKVTASMIPAGTIVLTEGGPMDLFPWTVP
jgi:hypothetical protein